jgi:hypothetical protein
VVQNYAKQAYETMASLMEAAALVARLQFGEILWWFFDWYPNLAGSQHFAGMAFYDADTQAAFQAAYGRSVARFLTVNDNPAINQSADAIFCNRASPHMCKEFRHTSWPGIRRHCSNSCGPWT